MLLVNKADIVTQIERELAYAPDLRQWDRDVGAVLNQRYQGLTADGYIWPFLKRIATLYALPDVTLANANVSIAAGKGGSNQRVLAVPATAFAGALYDTLDVGAALEIQPLMAEGGEMDLYDRSKRAVAGGNWEEAPFVIEQVEPSLAGNVNLSLDPRARITSITAPEGAYILRHPRVKLPPDVDQVLSIQDEDGRPLTPMSLEEATARWLTDPDPGRPTHFVVDGGHEPRFAPLVHPTRLLGSTNTESRSPDVYSRSNVPIRATPPFTATASAGAGLLTDVPYRFFVSWWYAGRFGPPSEVVEVTPSGGNLQVTLAGLPTLPDIAYGRTLAVFMSESDGPFHLAAWNTTQTSATLTITARSNTNDDNLQKPWGAVRWDEVYPMGPYTYVRLWPRSDTLRKLKLTYGARPRALISPNDEPEMKANFRDFLVWDCCVTIGTRYGAENKTLERWTGLRNEALARLQSHYRPEHRYAPQRGQVGADGRGLYTPFPNGVNYLG